MPRGRILRGRCPTGSGLMELDLETLDGDTIITVPCESAPTLRALASAFGERPVVGEIIDYDVDERGVMTQFWPSGGPRG